MIVASPEPVLAARAALASAESDAQRRSRSDLRSMIVPLSPDLPRYCLVAGHSTTMVVVAQQDSGGAHLIIIKAG
jgi:hypothetical protein